MRERSRKGHHLHRHPAYPSSEFKTVAEAVKIHAMSNGQLLVEMDELLDFMDSNGVQDIVEAVNIISEANNPDPENIEKLDIGIAIDEEALMEVKDMAEDAFKKKQHHICETCGKEITECTCNTYKESVSPEVAYFDNIVGIIETCITNGIEVVIKTDSLNADSTEEEPEFLNSESDDDEQDRKSVV